MNIKVELTNEECLEFFHNALCNGLDWIRGYGLELNYDDEDYSQAKTKLDNPCYEDVLMQILKDGKPLKLTDLEYNGEYNRTITIKDVYEKMPKVSIKYLIEMRDENDDADTADVILQTIFYNEIIFG